MNITMRYNHSIKSATTKMNISRRYNQLIILYLQQQKMNIGMRTTSSLYMQ